MNPCVLWVPYTWMLSSPSVKCNGNHFCCVSISHGDIGKSSNSTPKDFPSLGTGFSKVLLSPRRNELGGIEIMCPEDTQQHSSDLKLVEPGVAESPRSHLATDVPIPNNSSSLHSLLCNADLQDIFPAF